MLNPNGFENSRPDGIGVLEVGGDGEAGAPRRFVPLRRTELRGDVAGPLGALRLTQVFGYSAAECDRVLEAVYRFPLPGDAAVTSIRVGFGDVSIRAELADRRRAEADYKEARKAGRQAALATRESADVFTLQVAGLRPDQEVTVETAFVQQARPEGAGWSLRVPLTTAPRYVRRDEAGAGTRAAAAQPLGLLRDPGHRFTLDLALRGADAVESPTHRLDVTREGGCRRVRLRDGEVVPDRDCVLSWRPEQDRGRPALQVLLHDDPASAELFFLALVAPPATRDAGRGLPREVILLVDRSGSMEGPKWQAADWAVERFLSDLSGRDSFALGLFHTTTRWFAPAPRPADPRAVAEAVAFLKEHQDSGGTELGVALEQALDLGRGEDAGEAEVARHVLVITDAEVTDSGRIVRLAERQAGRADRRRVSVLCIDAAPNSALALELAERGGGVARFLTSDPEQEDIATALDEVLADWAEPVLADLGLEVDCAGVRAAGRAVDQGGRAGWSRIDLGDLPAGRPLWVVGRAPRNEAGSLSFRLTTRRGRELASCPREPARELPEGRALKALFGARQILGLEHLIHSGEGADALRDGLRRLGYDPQQVFEGRPGGEPRVYAENARAGLAAALRDLLVRESIGHGVASTETAFLAVRSEAGRVVEGRLAVANALPAGWSHDFLAGASAMAAPVAGLASVDSFLSCCSLEGDPTDLIENEADEDLDLFDTAAAPPPTALLSRASSSAYGGAPPSPRESRTGPTVVFSGAPAPSGGEAILFDSTQADGAGVLPDRVTLGRLVVRFPGGMPDPGSLDPGLALLIFVDDLTTPRARVRLADLIRLRGERPLNLRRAPGQAVRIVLADPAGAWAQGAPAIELALGW